MVLYSYTNAMRTKGFTKKIDQIVEQKMLEFFGDPDSGLIIKKTFLNRLKNGCKNRNYHRMIWF